MILWMICNVIFLMYIKMMYWMTPVEAWGSDLPSLRARRAGQLDLSFLNLSLTPLSPFLTQRECEKYTQ